MIKIILAFVMVILIGCTKGEKSAGSNPLQGHGTGDLPVQIQQKFPDVSLLDAAGTTTPVKSFEGKVVLIDFWASWCVPCIQELPDIQKLYEDKKGKGFVVLAVNTDNNAEEVIAEFKSKMGLTFPMFQDPSSELVSQLQIQGLPFTVVLDKNLKVRKIQPGSDEWYSKESLAFIDSLLSE